MVSASGTAVLVEESGDVKTDRVFAGPMPKVSSTVLVPLILSRTRQTWQPGWLRVR